MGTRVCFIMAVMTLVKSQGEFPINLRRIAWWVVTRGEGYGAPSFAKNHIGYGIYYRPQCIIGH